MQALRLGELFRLETGSLTSYWSRVENILVLGHPIGHVWGIFSFSDILLVTCVKCQRKGAQRVGSGNGSGVPAPGGYTN
jgi:hypothetical protein